MRPPHPFPDCFYDSIPVEVLMTMAVNPSDVPDDYDDQEPAFL